MDALTYSSMKSNLDPSDSTDQTTLTRLDNTYSKFFATSNSNMSHTAINGEITNALENTTIKRACCRKEMDTNGNYIVNVKILQPSVGFDHSDDGANTQLYNKFNYFVKQVLIPASYCTTYASENGVDFNGAVVPSYCDFFYDSYCENSKKIFSELADTNSWDYSTFTEYSPDCGCYQPNPLDDLYGSCSLKNVGCGDDVVKSGTTYLKTSERARECQPATVCISNIEVGTVAATNGGTVNITPVQNCSSIETTPCVYGDTGCYGSSGSGSSSGVSGGTASTGGKASSTVSTGGKASSTVSTGGKASSTVSTGGKASSTVSTGGKASSTAGSGGNTSSTASTGGNASSTVSSGGNTSSTASTGGNTNSTASTGGNTNSTASTGGNTNSTASTGGKASSTASTGGKASSTASTGGKASSTASTGGKASSASGSTGSSTDGSGSTGDSDTDWALIGGVIGGVILVIIIIVIIYMVSQR